jgi:hypothetical protein
MDFFIVPTVTFNLLYCFFIISHERSAHLALQLQSASNQLLDRPAATRGVSLRDHS